MTDWQPIETAPRDGTPILVWARWDWAAMGDPSDEPAWRVAVWGGASWHECEAFCSVTDNPYWDLAVEPTHWAPLPAVPTEPKGG